MLVAHLVALPPERQYLFTTGRGALMSRSDVYQRVWYPTREAAGYPQLRFHDLRHTAASLLLAFSGAKLSERKKILGHSQIAHTVTYTDTWCPTDSRTSATATRQPSAMRSKCRPRNLLGSRSTVYALPSDSAAFARQRATASSDQRGSFQP